MLALIIWKFVITERNTQHTSVNNIIDTDHIKLGTSLYIVCDVCTLYYRTCSSASAKEGEEITVVFSLNSNQNVSW